jgi:hypothetical protein
MKAILLASAVVVGMGYGSASAQSTGPTYSDTIHQSAGDRDSRGTPKYYQRSRASNKHASSKHASSKRARSTTGAGPRGNDPSAGPFYSDTIHQSAGDRDSRGTPKYNTR